MSPGALDLYREFLNEYNKLVEPTAQRRIIYSGGHYFIQTGTHIMLLERDPYFLELVDAVRQQRVKQQQQKEQLEMMLTIIERLIKVIERLAHTNKKSVRFSL